MGKYYLGTGNQQINFQVVDSTGVINDLNLSGLYLSVTGKAADADKLDNFDSSYFRNASNLTGVYTGQISGGLGNADTLDGYDSSYFLDGSNITGTVALSGTFTGYYTGVFSGTISHTDYIQFHTGLGLNPDPSELTWNDSQGTIELGLIGGGSTNLGQDLVAYVRNAETGTISKGQAVYLFGAQGDKATVKLASNLSDTTSSKTLGVAIENITAGQLGYVKSVGVVDGLSLSVYQPGDTLWLGSTPGSLTVTKPQSPNHMVFIGVVERAINGNGQLYVRVQNGYELEELHDVKLVNAQNNDIIRYNGSSGVWYNSDTLALNGTGSHYISGDLGIGTSSPSARLHVFGADKRQIIASTTDSAALTLGQWDGATNRIESSTRKLLITSYASGISLGISGSENVHVSPSGYLGVGTISPSNKLDVAVSAASSSFLTDSNVYAFAIKNSNTTAGNAVAMTFGHGSSPYTNFIASVRTGAGSIPTGDLVFGGRPTDSANFVERLRIVGTSGNVGIGTSAPQTALEVFRNTSSGKNIIHIYNSSSGASSTVGIGWSENDATNGNYNSYLYTVRTPTNEVRLDATTDKRFVIRTGTGGSTPTERMTVLSGGNVGIGQAAPSYKLEVETGSSDADGIRVRDSAVGVWTDIRRRYIECTGADFWINSQTSSLDLRTGNSSRLFISATGVVNITNTTSASSSTAGALTIGNGTGVTNVAIGGGNINAGGTGTFGGNLTVSGTGTSTVNNLSIAPTSGHVYLTGPSAAGKFITLQNGNSTGGINFRDSAGNEVGSYYQVTDAWTFSKNTTVSGNLTVSQNLIVNGTTTTINSTVTTIDDPIITLGGDTAPTTDDNKDRGVEFRWHNGTAAKVGFFGFDDSTGYLTFIPDATNTSEVFSGTQGDIQATNFRGILIGSISNALTAGTYLTGTSYNGSTAVTFAVDATSANTVSKVVARDGSGNFSAGTITASSFSGNLANTLTLNTSGTGLSGSTTFNNSGAATFTVTSNATNANTASTIVARDASGNFTAGTITAALSGNASTAATWQTARTLTIGSTGKSVNGSADVAWTLGEIGASPTAGSASIITLGTVTTGTWTAGIIASNYGGTGINNAGRTLTIGTNSGTITFTNATTTLTVANNGSISGTNTGDQTTISGNAGTATTWQTARTLTIGSTGKSVNGSADVAWTLGEIGAAATSHNHTSLTGVTSIGFAAEASDTASISTTISTSQTFFDFNLTDDNNNDLWRWRFTPSGSTVYNAMTLSPSANGVSDLVVSGTITGTRLISNIAVGTAPLTVTSTTLVTNLNADLVDGLHVHTGTNNVANQIVRTDANGYIQAGWINTISGDNGTTAIDRVYASSDGYIRYYSPTNFRTVLNVPTRTGGDASGTWGISITGNAGTATILQTARNLTINGTAKSFNGSADISWTAAEIGLTSYLPLTGGTISSNLAITGNLTVNGTTTTVNSTTVTIDDPIFTLGGDTAPASDDNKDRGIEFRWHNGSAAKVGFFGFDDSTGYFTFIPDSTNTSEVFSGTQGDIQASNFRGNLIGSVTGNITGNADTATTLQTARNIAGVSFNGSANISITGQNITTSVGTAANDLEVAKYLRWKNYGNNHILIDASAGTAPDNTTAVNRYTPTYTINSTGAGTNTWGEAISLMGWNGTATYGVRVDRARSIDNQANSATTTAASTNTANQIVLRDGSGNFSAGAITATSVSVSADQAIVNQHNGNASQWYGRILSKNSTNNRAIFFGTWGSVAAIAAQTHDFSAFADLYINTVDGSSGGTVRMPSSVLVNGNQVLHAGNYTTYVGNGTLTLAVSGTGLSGSASFTANQSGNTTFTVTSNATSANTASAIVARDGSGNFSAGAITASSLDISGNSVQNVGLARFTNNYAAGGVYYPTASFIQTRGAHSYGIVSEFRTNTAGDSDRPSILFYGAQGAHSWQVGQITSGWGTVDNFGIGYRASNTPSSFASWPTNYFTITTGGSVGIGTTSPGSLLHLNAASGVPYQTFSVANTAFGYIGAAGAFFSGQGTNLGMYGGGISKIILGARNSPDLTIDTTGNIGIGITSPGYRLEVNGSFAATTKSFVIPHPTKEGKKLRYGSLEGPENGVYIRGKTTSKVIELPDYWTKLVDPDSISVQLTPIGSHQKLYVEKIENNKVYIANENLLAKGINCFFYILAERADVEKLQVEIDA